MQSASSVRQQQFSSEEIDVVVIGNGPSGICLSLFLNGYWPFFGGKHVNPVLQERLMESPDVSLVEQDLEYLSDSLEGRSQNPVAVLFDTLNHPNADFGEDLPSSLVWRFDQAKTISHLVIGSDEIGGSWNNLQNSKILSLSHKDWLELPIYRYKEWEDGKVDQDFSSLQSKNGHSGIRRTTVSNVCDYYSDYVKELNLDHSMMSNACVTSVRPLEVDVVSNQDVSVEEKQPSSNSDHCLGFCDLSSTVSWADLEEQLFMRLQEESSSLSPCTHSELSSSGSCTPCEPLSLVSPDEREHIPATPKLWCVEGLKKQENGTFVPFTVQARNVVLACGVSNCPNRLEVPGEDLHFVRHNLNNVSSLLDSVKSPVRPILVVGAGLSAADVINLTLSKGIPVCHVFRRDARDPKLIFSKLAPSVYPEYQSVFSLMKGETVSSLYKSFPLHTIQSFEEDGLCVLQDKQNPQMTTTVKVSNAFVLIGSTADLSFLSETIPPLGATEGARISPKKNPLEIDRYTFESLAHDGLFGMGPLVGDNFVRFALGGALGITSKLWKEKMANSVT